MQSDGCQGDVHLKVHLLWQVWSNDLTFQSYVKECVVAQAGSSVHSNFVMADGPAEMLANLFTLTKV